MDRTDAIAWKNRIKKLERILKELKKLIRKRMKACITMSVFTELESILYKIKEWEKKHEK